ncbi:transposase [Leptospira sp. GIMC2001]|uniref:transposase n=1 Tax=Leptospira sp. GIMC2001 TaxID=1513297 RepID=UPI00234B8B92|nr:transposase [Leptospira sp. GIMC2001]WCL51061.1 transposase [Leptospira sp. GIMC2001]
MSGQFSAKKTPKKAFTGKPTQTRGKKLTSPRRISTNHKSPLSEPDSANASSASDHGHPRQDTSLFLPPLSISPNFPRKLLDNLLNPSTINKEQLLQVNLISSNKQIKEHYTGLTYRILEAFYPTYCNTHTSTLLTPGKIKGRQLMGQCPICKAQKSLAKGTPLMNLHLPMSYFSYILQEILIAYPSVLTAKAIQKKLVLKSYSSAWLLKKRIQIFMTHLNDSMMEQTKEALSQEASMNMGSKMPFSGDVSDSIKGRIITNVDTLAIFSVGVRANKFRSRYRHGGITSSIYQSAKVGGAQVGTLASNITIKGSLSFYESHPLTNTDYALSHLEKVITPENVLMADEAYQGLFGHYRNIRTINHSRRANKKIHVFSRERWSKDGVHSNVVEGSNGILKKAMKQYNWFNCKYSQLYLNEYAVGKNIRFFDVEKNVIFGIGDTSKNCGKKIRE